MEEGAPGDGDVEAAVADGADHDTAESDHSETAGRVARLRRQVTSLVAGTRIRRIVALVLAVVLVLGAVGGFAWWRLTALPEGAALAVGDVVVTSDELDQRVQTLQALYGVEPPTEPDRLDSFRRDAAKSVAVSTLLDQEAVARGLVVSDKEAGDVLNRFVEQQFGPGGRAAFVQTLGNVGASEASVTDEIKRQLAVSRLTDQVVGPVTVDDAELRTAFDQRRDQLGTPELRSVRHIVVGDEAAAKDVVGRLNAGTPFEQLARERSLDQSTRDSGGNLGQARRDQLDPAFGDAAFTASPGAVFGPLQTERGWYVGRVDAVTPPVPAEFDQVKDSLRQTLEAEKALDRWRGWLGDAIRSGDVRYADDYRPADPEALPGPGAGQTPAPPR
ncbi:peptidylprolyl isomerase [Pseudonocardia alni]|uniref:peptidylprolyl isomerase n=1 Tax=Pseudonocardia alni TaxID=33907 RepID=UPI003407051B